MATSGQMMVMTASSSMSVNALGIRMGHRPSSFGLTCVLTGSRVGTQVDGRRAVSGTPGGLLNGRAAFIPANLRVRG